MGLEDFHGKWNVMTSGRTDKLPMGPDEYLCIYTKEMPGGEWVLKTQSGNDTPVPLGTRQWNHGYQDVLISQVDGSVQRMQRFYCAVEFPDRTYCFEAVLATQMVNDRPAVYGHLYPISPGPFQGEGATGGWSADRQGDPPTEEEG